MLSPLKQFQVSLKNCEAGGLMALISYFSFGIDPQKWHYNDVLDLVIFKQFNLN